MIPLFMCMATHALVLFQLTKTETESSVNGFKIFPLTKTETGISEKTETK